MRHLILAFAQFVLLSGLFCAGSVSATEVTIPLYKLMTENKPLRMGNQSGSTSLSIPLAKRMALKQAKMHLVYTNSISLVRNRSSLAVLVNGKTVKQVALDPSQPDSAVDFNLPAELFKTGYNKLGFNVVHHSVEGGANCEDEMAPELWTEIDKVKSTITFDGDLRSVKPVLSDLENYFDPKLGNYWKVNVLTGQSGVLDTKHLEWANLASQGVATRLQYVPLAVHYASAEPASAQAGDFPGLNHTGLTDTDSVLVGTAAELSPYLSAEIKSAIKGAFLGVYPLDASSGRVIMVISGLNEQEVSQAALTFAHSMISMPDAQSTVVQNFAPPKWNPYDATGMLRYAEKYTLKRLGLDSQSVKGFYANDMALNFSVPPDMFANERKGIKLDLHLSYGAGLRSDSVVNILLNRHFVTAIHLNAASGAELRHYEIVLPARSLLPGKNIVEIQPQMTPSVTGNCTLAQDRNLMLTLYGDSVLTMPEAEHYARMPDMALMANGSFPYSVLPNGSNTQVWLPNVSQDSASAAMTLLGRLTQQTGIPLSAVSFMTAGQPDASKNLIVVGETHSLPISLNSKSPYQFENGSITTTDATNLIQPSPAATVGLGEVGTMLNTAEQQGDRPLASFKNNGSMGETALLMQFESPFAAGKTATVLTAASAQLLAHRTDALVTPEFWTNVKGDVFRWQETEQSIFSDSIGSVYHIGSVGPLSRMDYYFSHYPWLWIAVALLILLMFVLVSRKLITRYRDKHYAEISTK